MKPVASPLDSKTVWLLLGDRGGETAQQRALGAALQKELGVRVIEKPLRGESSSMLAEWAPPWPALVVSFGSGAVSSAQIKRESSGRTKIVQLARSRGVPMAYLDLIVPMPQDRVEVADNVFHLKMPLNILDPEGLDRARDRWAQSLAHLQRPWTLLMIGGPSRHFDFDREIAIELTRQVNQHVRTRGGSLLVTTSPRTPERETDAIRETIDVPSMFYRFVANDPENPLRGYLALADDVVVTGDTSSMLAEAWRSGKPVYVAPLPRKIDLRRRLILASRLLIPEAGHRILRKRGLVSPPVDLAAWIAELRSKGAVSELGGQAPRQSYDPEDDDDLYRLIDRIKTLLQ